MFMGCTIKIIIIIMIIRILQSCREKSDENHLAIEKHDSTPKNYSKAVNNKKF